MQTKIFQRRTLPAKDVLEVWMVTRVKLHLFGSIEALLGVGCLLCVASTSYLYHDPDRPRACQRRSVVILVYRGTTPLAQCPAQ